MLVRFQVKVKHYSRFFIRVFLRVSKWNSGYRRIILRIKLRDWRNIGNNKTVENSKINLKSKSMRKMCVSKSHYRDFFQLNATEKQNFWYFIKNVISKALYLNNISYRIFYPSLSCFYTRYMIYESRYNAEDNKILEKCTEQMGKLVNVRFSFHN